MYVKNNDVNLWEVVISIIGNGFDDSESQKLIFRDFLEHPMQEKMFLNKGFVKVEMPETAVFEWQDEEHRANFKSALSKRNRRHFTTDVMPFIESFDIKHLSQLTTDQLHTVYQLYLKVKDNNTAINNFAYDFLVFEKMNQHPNWSFLVATLPNTHTIVGCMFCYTNEFNQSFNPILIGMSDEIADRLTLYRQLLYHTLQTANKPEFKKVFLGYSAIFEKKKLGANSFKKYAYIQAKDNFNADLLATFEN